MFCPARRKLSYQPKIVIFDNKQNKKVALNHRGYVIYLGILIDKNLSWKHHIDHIIIKIAEPYDQSQNYDTFRQRIPS